MIKKEIKLIQMIHQERVKMIKKQTKKMQAQKNQRELVNYFYNLFTFCLKAILHHSGLLDSYECNLFKQSFIKY